MEYTRHFFTLIFFTIAAISFNASAARVIDDNTTINGKLTVASILAGSHPCPSQTETQRDAIVGAIAGDCVYNSTTSKYNYYNGTGWEIAAEDDTVVHLSGNETISGVKTFTGKTVAQSTTNGFKPCPSMTQTQRDAVVGPISGDCVYNTDTNTLNVYNGSTWQSAGGGISNWQTAYNYAQYDVVIESNKIYQATVAHTSGVFATDLGAGKWIELSASAAASISGKAGTAASVTIAELQTPAFHLTNTDTNKYLLETANDNIVPDPGLEGLTNQWTAYDDAAAAPVDGTSGTVTTTCTSSTSSPLEGTQSLLITKGAANYQGEGCSLGVTIPVAGAYKNHLVSFEYEATHANYADDYIKVYLISPTNEIIEVLAGDNGVKASGNGYTFTGVAQARAAGAYKLALHIYDSSSSAWTFKADNFSVSRSKRPVKGAVVTDWVSFTPTGSWVTNTTYTGKYRRVGDAAEIQYSWTTSGAPTAANLSLNLPSGLSIDSSKFATATAPRLGEGLAFDTGVDGNVIFGYYSGSATSIGVNYLRTYNGTNPVNITPNLPVSSTAPFTWGNTDTAHVTVTVPISGWSSNMQLSDDGGTRQIAMSAAGNAGTAITGDVTDIPFTTTAYDYTASWNGTTYTVPETGIYRISGQVRFNAAVDVIISAWIGGVTNTKGFSDSGSAQVHGFSGELSLNKGQLLTIRASGNGTLQNVPVHHHLQISKISSPQTLAGSETVVAKYTTAASPAVVTGTVIKFTTKVEDSHNAYDISTGLFTCPLSGRYEVNASTLTGGAVTAVGNYYSIYVIQGTSGELVQSPLDYSENTASRAYGAQVNTTIRCNKGNTISVWFDESFPAVNLNANAVYNQLSITRVGN